jgi:hypothetical protein
VGAPTGLTISRQGAGSVYGDKALRLADPGTGNAFFPILATGFAPASDNLHWVVEYEVKINTGDLKRVGVQFRSNRMTGYFGANVDLAAKHPTASAGQTIRDSALFTVAPLGGASGAPTTNQAWFYTNLSSFSGGAYSAKNLTLHRLQFRPATPEEVAAGTVLPGLQASVTTNTLAIVDLENQQALAAYELLANASGGDPAYLRLVSSTAGGYAALASSVVALQTTSGGQVKTALRAFNGNVHIGDKLYLGDDGLWVFDPVTKTESIRGAGFAKVRGRGFGLNGDLTEWSGPNIAIGSMSKTNGVRWEDINGNAYFGGSLSAGILTNKVSTSSLSFGATAETARFGSNGGSIKVTLSLSGGWAKQYWNPTSLANASENGNVVVTLYRSVNGGAFNAVATLPMTYGWTRTNQGNEPGLGWSIVEQGSYGASLTYTDPQTSTQDRQYRAMITTFSPNTLPGALTSQNLTIICVE